jgi:hypothetical protein
MVSSRPSKASTLSYFIVLARWLAAYALLNAPFWWWGQHSFISRPWFNVELMVPALLIGFYPALGYLSLLVAWLLDCLVSQSATFYFTSPLDFLRSIRFLNNLGWLEYISLDRLLILVPFIIAAWLLPKVIGRSRKGWWIGVALPVVIALLDVGNGSSMFSNRAIRLVDANIAGSPTVTLLVRTMASTSDLPLVKLDAASSTRRLVSIEDWATAHPSRSALLILVESFGLHSNPAVHAWLERQLWDADVALRYRKIDGQVPFHGSTTNGELRELCGMAGSYRKVGTAQETLACLPQALDELGWTTTGLHGFSQAMFLRSLWWPRTGLQHLDFAEQLLAAESPRCGGAFAGACDADVIGKGFAIARSPRQFAYVLTLNSHLPIKPGVLPDELRGICASERIEDADCQFVSILGNMLRAVRQGMKDAPASNVPLVVMAGDHAPPFSDRKIREGYSQTHVQAFALVPLN